MYAAPSAARAAAESTNVLGSTMVIAADQSALMRTRYSDDLLTREDPDAHLGGRIEANFRHAPVTAIYGGTSEINRDLVAEAHLGLPRVRS